MQMTNGLATVFPAVVDHAIPMGKPLLLRDHGNGAEHLGHAITVGIGDIVGTGDMLFGNDKNMHRCHWVDITERIDESDPLFWSVRLGDVPEKGVVQGKHGEHMRIIIGYNEDRGEILYSDSWGEGHELKRMDGQDALSITTGMYYLAE